VAPEEGAVQSRRDGRSSLGIERIELVSEDHVDLPLASGVQHAAPGEDASRCTDVDLGGPHDGGHPLEDVGALVDQLVDAAVEGLIDGDAVAALDQTLVAALSHRPVQRLEITEVVVDQPERDAGPFGDPVRGRLEVPFGEELEDRVDDRRPRALGPGRAAVDRTVHGAHGRAPAGGRTERRRSGTGLMRLVLMLARGVRSGGDGSSPAPSRGRRADAHLPPPDRSPSHRFPRRGPAPSPVVLSRFDPLLVGRILVR
jgi:hypothetical protein